MWVPLQVVRPSTGIRICDSAFFPSIFRSFFSVLQQDQDVFTLWLHFEYSLKDLHRGCFSPA